MKCFLLWALVASAAASAISVKSRAPLDEEWGYVEVRTGANMFWALYHTDQPGEYTTYPLIMWLQGGPGSSGVGFGNFGELGPYDIYGNNRPYAWTKKANVMFIDNPVGTGYSYVEDDSGYATTNAEIADDLVTCVKDIFKTNPDLEKMPFFVYAESYGGKMTVDFALAFDKAIKNGEVTSDFRGVALGDSWISPMDSVNTWGSYLYHMGFVNRKGQKKIDYAATRTQAAVDAGEWELATMEWGTTESVVEIVAHNVNFYNVLAKEDIYNSLQKPHSQDLSFMSPEVRRLYNRHVLGHVGQINDDLSDFMNGPQAERWNIPDYVTWGSQSGQVFDHLNGDFMKPAIDSVIKLLTETGLQVIVYTGDLDLICDTPGTYKWIEDMEWPGKSEWTETPNDALYVSEFSYQAAVVQHSNNFSLFTIFRSGHMVPLDAPETSLLMIDKINEFSKVALKKKTSEPKPEKKTSEPKPEKKTSEPKSEKKTSKPQPEKKTSEPQPEKKTSKPKPQKKTSKPKPQKKTSKPKPEKKTSEPKPEKKTSEPRPEKKTSEPKPEKKTSKPKPEKKTSEPKPEKKTSEPKPEKKASEPKPEKKTSKPKPQKKTSKPKPEKKTSKPKPQTKTRKENI